jgi:hypothetical protein
MKKTAFSRMMTYFHTADIHEAQAALASAQGIVTSRTAVPEGPARKTRTRRVRANGAESNLTQEATA